MTFTAIPCWQCKGIRSVRIKSKPIEVDGEKFRVVEGPAIKQPCWFCRGTGYLNQARIKEYERRKRRLLSNDAQVVARRDILVYE